GLADLFTAVVVIAASTHPIEILRNGMVVSVRQSVPVDRLVAVVTGSRPRAHPYEASVTSDLADIWQISNDHIGTRNQRRRSRAGRTAQRGHDDRLRLAVHQLRDLDRSHRCANGDFSNGGTSI